MTIHFGYEKAQVIQALRYHFISKIEIRLMIILINVFAIGSLLLYTFKKITALAFLSGSLMWLLLMICFWFLLPYLVYRKTDSFQHKFSMSFNDHEFSLNHSNGGGRSWPWESLSLFVETPHFFHLYFNKQSFFLVPKNACKSSEELIALRHLLTEKIKTK